MARSSLNTPAGSTGPSLETFQLTSGLHVPFSLLRGMGTSDAVDIKSTDDGYLKVGLTTGTGVTRAPTTVSSTAVIICPANPSRRSVTIQAENNPIRIGYDNTVSTTKGLFLDAGQATEEGYYTGAIYAIRIGTVDAVVQVLEAN